MLTCHVYLLSIVIATIETDTIKKVTKTNMAHINAMAWKNSLKSFFAVNNKEDNDEDGGDNFDTEFKVLCIGDSLTEGYYGILHHYHPYTMKLQEMITNSLGNRVKVYTRGKGGEKVHEEMMERLRSELNQTEASSTKPLRIFGTITQRISRLSSNILVASGNS
ncbi:uncharacterized protein LOC130614497 [Hydractinia symbiolongicarpus]|uniref:uncharacterized protein LOC130614497 n=1 Tax=Hydractinia symbiolongicarpus TaxID=13093 RepID=UPI0025506DE7|nr:uncharacterized protein LOC130614497 [Hydractinia symbiolongicarpus]